MWGFGSQQPSQPLLFAGSKALLGSTAPNRKVAKSFRVYRTRWLQAAFCILAVIFVAAKTMLRINNTHLVYVHAGDPFKAGEHVFVRF